MFNLLSAENRPKTELSRTSPVIRVTLTIGLIAWAPPSWANPAAPEASETRESGEATQPNPPAAEGGGLDAQGTYLRPNMVEKGSPPFYVHVTSADMPWRVAVGYPARVPIGATIEETRLIAIDAMRTWERAIQPQLPWFRLEFVEEDASAPVQFTWTLRSDHPIGGFGRIRFRSVRGEIQVAGEMQITPTPNPSFRLNVDQLRALVTHEFGHVLGLRRCVECDSAMREDWYAHLPVEVTETDVRTFLALLAQPNGPVAPTPTRAEPE